MQTILKISFNELVIQEKIIVSNSDESTLLN